MMDKADKCRRLGCLGRMRCCTGSPRRQTCEVQLQAARAKWPEECINPDIVARLGRSVMPLRVSMSEPAFSLAPVCGRYCEDMWYLRTCPLYSMALYCTLYHPVCGQGHPADITVWQGRAPKMVWRHRAKNRSPHGHRMPVSQSGTGPGILCRTGTGNPDPMPVARPGTARKNQEAGV